MKRSGLNTILIALAMLGLSACGDTTKLGSNSTLLPAGCVIGQPCVSSLASGGSVNFQGTLTGVNNDQASFLAKTINGSLSTSGTNFDTGTVNITATGAYGGGTNYNVTIAIYPRSNSNYFSFCATVGGNCFNPIIISGNAAYYPMGNGGHMLMLQYGGLKFTVVATTGATDNAWNGSVATLNDVKINLVRVGNSPITQGELLASTSLTMSTGYNGYSNYGLYGY